MRTAFILMVRETVNAGAYAEDFSAASNPAGQPTHMGQPFSCYPDRSWLTSDNVSGTSKTQVSLT